MNHRTLRSAPYVHYLIIQHLGRFLGFGWTGCNAHFVPLD